LTDLIGSLGPVFVVSAAVFGPLSSWLAGRRDRNPVVWLAFGALLGPIAVLLLSASPPGRCAMCDTPVRGWASICAVCGAPLSITAAGRYQEAQPRPTVSVAPVAEAAAQPGYGSPTTPIRTVPVLTMLGSDNVEGRTAPHGGSAPIPLPIERVGATRIRRPEFSDTSRGATRAPGDAHEADVAEVLATGVYFGGTAGLAVGGRYVIVRQGPHFRLLGPVDLDPTRVALERPLARLVAVAVGERLVITEGDGARVSLAIGMGALAGMNGPELELALARPEGSAMDRQPASG
jgi:hypothetical protein